VAPAGELVVQNGKKGGSRRPLGKILTCIGQALNCDVRLQGISPFHCLLIRGPGGLELRDLDSASGTLVNGKRVARAQLRDGDTLQVGAFQFRLQLPPPAPEGTGSAAQSADALRVQAAAVAAQQAALTQEEGRLHKRKQALEQQEEQLSRHLEEKRKKLIQLNESAQTERAGLTHERQAYEQFVQQVSTNLTQAQRELVDKQQQLQAQRSRLSALHQRLKQRWQRMWKAEKQKQLLREEELANEEANLAQESERLDQERQSLAQERLEFNGQYELGRRQLLNAWSRLRQAQQKWRQRRSGERAALRLRSQDLEAAELEVIRTHKQLEQEKTDWHNRRLGLEKEAEALNTRIHNQRDKIFEQQQEISRLEAMLRGRRPAAVSEEEKPDVPALEEKKAAEAPAATPAAPTPADDALWQSRLAELDRLAGELADQRLQLAEHWERLVQTQHRWQLDRDQAAADLEGLGQKLQDQEQALERRQQDFHGACDTIRDKHQELVRMRQHMIGWHSRLRIRESTWEAERGQLLAEVRQREKLVQDHLSNLVEIRRRWAKNRRQEVAKLQAERRGCESLRQEYASLRLEWHRRSAALDDEKRSVAEKSLALEQFRQETITHSGNSPAAEHRVERLRRNWLTQNAAAIRAVTEERKTLEIEFADLEKRFTQLQKRGDEVIAAETAFAEKQAAWDHKQALWNARQAQMQQELKIAHSQRQGAENQLAKMRDEVEHIARTLLDEPEPPACLADQAA
jgi:chromosome segregation ATPase